MAGTQFDNDVFGRVLYFLCGWFLLLVILPVVGAIYPDTMYWKEVLVGMGSITCCCCCTFIVVPLCCCLAQRERVEPGAERQEIWSSVVFNSMDGQGQDFELMKLQTAPSGPVKTVLGKISVTSKPCIAGSTCSCCLEDFSAEDVVARLPCGHVFHEKCIMNWFLMRASNNCPMCRSRAAEANGAELCLMDVP